MLYIKFSKFVGSSLRCYRLLIFTLFSDDMHNFMSVVAAQLNHAAGLALSVKKRLVFWTDLREKTIYR